MPLADDRELIQSRDREGAVLAEYKSTFAKRRTNRSPVSRDRGALTRSAPARAAFAFHADKLYPPNATARDSFQAKCGGRANSVVRYELIQPPHYARLSIPQVTCTTLKRIATA